MSTKNTYWMKLHTGLLDNPVFMKLSEVTKWHYIALSLTAKKAEAGGWIVWDNQVLSIDDMAFQIRSDAESLKNSIDILVKNGLLHYENDNVLCVSKWEELQENDTDSAYAERIREQTRNRVAKHRAKLENSTTVEKEEEKEEEKNKNKTCNVTVTLHEKTEDFSLIDPKDDKQSVSSEISSEVGSRKETKKVKFTREEYYQKLKKYLEKRFIINIPEKNKYWAEFLNFALDKEFKEKQSVETFVNWALDNGYDAQFWTPEKLMTYWPKAFVETAKAKAQDDNFYAGCSHTTEVEEKKYVAIPRYKPTELTQ